MADPSDTATLADNPFIGTWATPFAMPPFQAIETRHFAPAFKAALTAHEAEIKDIADNTAAPTFENTIEAMERCGVLLDRVGNVFFNLTGAYTSEALQAIERDIAPVLSRHYNAISLNEALFRRIQAIWETRASATLDAEQMRVLERYHTSFIRSGAGLDETAKRRFAAINERLAVLGTQFGQNVLTDEAQGGLELDDESDLIGLPDFVKAAAAQAATDRGRPGKHIITLSRSIIEPFLQFSTRRDLREKAFHLWTARGQNGGTTDNCAIVAETVALRAELARLLGYPTFAHFRLDDAMAKTPEAVQDFLLSVWTPARKRAEREKIALQAIAQADGDNFTIEPWDWRFYAERQRKAEFDLDEAQIKPYLQLDNMMQAAFATAHALFGLSFEEKFGLPLYHPDVRAFEVTKAGEHVGLFLGDYFARASKHSGAWMSDFRSQDKLNGNTRPIIVNVMNFARAASGPTLLSFDDARTLFHEFGHALHGLLSNVTYPKISGTSVARDFVEFPSQLYEHWLEQTETLRRHAVHCHTGEPMSDALIKRVLDARLFNQGCTTVEYLASALVDLDFHLIEGAPPGDVLAFESDVLTRIGMPASIVMRHATSHFTHVFSGNGYSSAYYSYLWSEILDADGFSAFEETGDIFDSETAKRLYQYVYSAGGRRDPAEAYRLFRGSMPKPEAVLKQRGLLDA